MTFTMRLARWSVALFARFLVCVLLVPPLLLAALLLRLLRVTPRRTFIGVSEIADNIRSIQATLDRFGVPTIAVIRPNRFYAASEAEAPLSMGRRILVNDASSGAARLWWAFVNPLLLGAQCFWLLNECGVWFFVWRDSLLPFNLDYLVARLAGHRLILMHCGDDVRYRPLQRVIDGQFGLQKWSEAASSHGEFFRKFFYVWFSETCASSIVSLRNQATFQRRHYVHFRFPQAAVALAGRTERGRDNVPARVVHCPSSRQVKGTATVLSAVRLLGPDAAIDFKLLENVSNSVVLDELARADILIDQPGDWVGRLAIEGCAASCAVIGGNIQDYNARYDSPVVQFEDDPERLKETLRRLIEDRSALQRLRDESHRFWSANYSPEAFYRFYLDLVAGTAGTFAPLPNQRKLLIEGASSRTERFFLTMLYHPVPN